VSLERAIDQFAVGDSVTVEQSVRAEDIDRFADLSGDTSAIHMSQMRPASRGLGGRVAHGLLLGSWFRRSLERGCRGTAAFCKR